MDFELLSGRMWCFCSSVNFLNQFSGVRSRVEHAKVCLSGFGELARRFGPVGLDYYYYYYYFSFSFLRDVS